MLLAPQHSWESGLRQLPEELEQGEGYERPIAVPTEGGCQCNIRADSVSSSQNLVPDDQLIKQWEAMEFFVFIFALAARKLGTKSKNNYSDNFISSDKYKYSCLIMILPFLKNIFFYFLLP